MLAELWGIEWLFWWQFPLFGVLVPVVVFGGGTLLWVGGRFCAKAPKATYWWSIAAHILSTLCMVAVLILLPVLGGLAFGPAGAYLAFLVGVAAGLLACWWVIKAMFATTFGGAVLAWLPTLAQGVFFLPFLAALLVPTLQQASELTNRTICMSNLSSIGKAITLYQGLNNGRMPPDLDALIADGQPAKLFRCPSADPMNRPPGQKHDYFYLPAPASADPNRIIACDFRANHRGKQRNVLYAGMNVGKMTEADFQAALADPVNAELAAALRAVEPPQRRPVSQGTRGPTSPRRTP
jgi:hypothetical protein